MSERVTHFQKSLKKNPLSQILCIAAFECFWMQSRWPFVTHGSLGERQEGCFDTVALEKVSK